MKLGNIGGKFLTPRQGKSYFMVKQCDTDYLKILATYDSVDWDDWFKIRRN